MGQIRGVGRELVSERFSDVVVCYKHTSTRLPSTALQRSKGKNEGTKHWFSVLEEKKPSFFDSSFCTSEQCQPLASQARPTTSSRPGPQLVRARWQSTRAGRPQHRVSSRPARKRAGSEQAGRASDRHSWQGQAQGQALVSRCRWAAARARPGQPPPGGAGLVASTR